MRKEDQPPERIWLNDEAIAAHFERIHEKYSTGSGTEMVEVADLDQNELTKGLR